MAGLVDRRCGKISEDLMACVFVARRKALVNVSPDPIQEIQPSFA